MSTKMTAEETLQKLERLMLAEGELLISGLAGGAIIYGYYEGAERPKPLGGGNTVAEAVRAAPEPEVKP